MNGKSSTGRKIPRLRSVIRNENLMAGLFFVLVGGLALWLALDYPVGSATRMLAGYFPRLTSVLLILLGLVIASRGPSAPADTEEDPPAPNWQPVLFVPLAMVAFGGTIETLGLVLAVFVAVVVLAFAENTKRWGETLAMGIGLSAFVYIVFVWALGLNIPVFPRF